MIRACLRRAGKVHLLHLIACNENTIALALAVVLLGLRPCTHRAADTAGPT